MVGSPAGLAAPRRDGNVGPRPASGHHGCARWICLRRPAGHRASAARPAALHRRLRRLPAVPVRVSLPLRIRAGSWWRWSSSQPVPRVATAIRGDVVAARLHTRTGRIHSRPPAPFPRRGAPSYRLVPGTMAPPAPMSRGKESGTRSSTKRAAQEDVIDVDNIPSATVEPSTKGKGPAKAARYQEPIGVDDPATWVTPTRSSAGDPASERLNPTLKFDGAVGVALYEQKLEVLTEDARGEAVTLAADLGATPATKAVKAGGASSAGGRATPGASSSVVWSPTGSGAASSLVTDKVAKLQKPWTEAAVPAACTPSGPVVPVVGSAAGYGQSSRRASVTEAVTRGRKVEMPPGHLSLPRTKNRSNRSRSSRRGFVRKAAVMTAIAPRMYADPPTPPGGWSDAETASSDGDSELSNGEEDDATVGASSSAGPARAPTPAANVVASTTRSAETAAAGIGKPDDRESAAGAAYVPVPMASSTSTEPNETASRTEGDGRTPGPTPVVTRVALAADALAEQLAERSRNPRIFPVGAFWSPGTAALLPGVQFSSGGLPPFPPPVANRVAAASVGAGRSPSAAMPATISPVPPPLVRAHQPPPPGTDDGSSEEMDDDALVSAYITPPASPRFSPTDSPRRTPALSGTRRRASASGAQRTTAAASTAGAAARANNDVEHATLTLRDVMVALRTGFSSVRRESGRLRAELVVVKSQAASSLRRMDGIAAAADGTQSGSGVVLERLSKLEMLLQALNERLPKEGGDKADGGRVANTLGLVNEIKVRPRAARCNHPMSCPVTVLGRDILERLSC